MTKKATIKETEYPLPVGMQEFEEFAQRILAKSGKYADEESMKYALAVAILHADATKGSLPDSYFIDRLRKAAANQVASQVFQDIKNKQEAAAKLKQAEATANAETVASGQETRQ